MVVKNRGACFFLAGLLATLAGGWIVFPRVLYQRMDQPLQFSHRLHTSEKVGLTCESCHSIQADGRFTGIPGIQKCAECHAQPLGTTAEEKKLVDEFITPQREIPWRVYARQPENVYFSHVQHVQQAQLPCERCHGNHGATETLRAFQQNRLSGYSRDIWGHSISRLRNGPDEGMKMDDCSRCHHARGVQESCLACHK